MANTALPQTPNNLNPLQPNKFQLTFGRLPNIQFFCQAVTVPGISIGEIPIPTPFVEKYSPGEKAIYDLLNVTFVIDEEMRSWNEVHEWIRGMSFPTEFEEYKKLDRQQRNSFSRQPQFSDASLTLYSSSYTPYYRFKFYDLFPTSLSSFVVSTSDTPESIITADATFRFTYYNVEKLI